MKSSAKFAWVQHHFTQLRYSCFGLGAAQAWLKEMGVSAMWQRQGTLYEMVYGTCAPHLRSLCPAESPAFTL